MTQSIQDSIDRILSKIQVLDSKASRNSTNHLKVEESIEKCEELNSYLRSKLKVNEQNLVLSEPKGILDKKEPRDCPKCLIASYL